MSFLELENSISIDSMNAELSSIVVNYYEKNTKKNIKILTKILNFNFEINQMYIELLKELEVLSTKYLKHEITSVELVRLIELLNINKEILNKSLLKLNNIYKLTKKRYQLISKMRERFLMDDISIQLQFEQIKTKVFLNNIIDLYNKTNIIVNFINKYYS